MLRMRASEMVTVTVVVVVAVMLTGWPSEAQTVECIAGMGFCLSPLTNSSETPSIGCCIPLNEALKNQSSCLCDIYKNPSSLTTYFNVTADQVNVFRLASQCGVPNADPSTCTSSGSFPPPGKSTPTPTPGTKIGAASVVAWSGLSLMLALMASFLL